MSDCLFLKNDTITSFSRRLHCLCHDPSSWAFVFVAV